MKGTRTMDLRWRMRGIYMKTSCRLYRKKDVVAVRVGNIKKRYHYPAHGRPKTFKKPQSTTPKPADGAKLTPSTSASSTPSSSLNANRASALFGNASSSKQQPQRERQVTFMDDDSGSNVAAAVGSPFRERRASIAPSKMAVQRKTVDQAVGPSEPMSEFTSTSVQVELVAKDAEERIRALNIKYDEAEEKYRETVARYESDLENMRREHESERRQWQTDSQALSATVANLEMRLGEAKAAVIEHQDSADSWKAKALDSEKVVQSLEKELSALKENEVQLQSTISSLQTLLTTSQTAVSSLSTSHAALTEEASRLRTELRNLEEERSQLTSHVAEATASKVDTERALQVAKEAEKKLEGKCEELGRDVTRLTVKNEAMTLRQEEMEKKAQANAKQIAELQSTINTLMKFPDASLGQAIQVPEFSVSQDYDQALQEIISSNNLRISVLENKNNEYRMLRIKRVDIEKKAQQQAPPSAPSPIENDTISAASADVQLSNDRATALWDGSMMGKVATVLAAAQMDQQAALHRAAINTLAPGLATQQQQPQQDTSIDKVGRASGPPKPSQFLKADGTPKRVHLSTSSRSSLHSLGQRTIPPGAYPGPYVDPTALKQISNIRMGIFVTTGFAVQRAVKWKGDPKCGAT
ncbi:hypothetical protein HK102_000567 [Quaeritorhiza haematococci]|nr:hypothetical protein HK102_000567 [Quaeritorhiza haematococci]